MSQDVRVVRALCLLAVVVGAGLGPVRPAGAGELLAFGASFRTIGAVLDNYDEPLIFGAGNGKDGLSVSLLRLTAEGGRRGAASVEAHIVQDLVFSSAPPGTATAGGVTGAEGAARYRALDLSWNLVDGEDVEGTLFVDRLNVRGTWGPVDVTLGRQAVSFSQAYFWNPLDIFLPFDPEAFDRSYKPGVDALRLDLALGPFSSLTLVAAAGNSFRIEPHAGGLRVSRTDFADEPWEGSAIVGRGRTTLNHWDVTLQGGKVSGGWQVGGGFAGEAGPLGVRGEGTWFFADGGDVLALTGPRGGGGFSAPVTDDHGKAVVGADHLFESSLHLNAEYFYNGAGEEDLAPAVARVLVGDTTNLGEHFLGIQASYDLHPLLAGQIAWIHSFTDGSDLLTPTLRWSLADEAECIFGAILGFGDRPAVDPGQGRTDLGSEFGSASDLYFTELIFYF